MFNSSKSFFSNRPVSILYNKKKKKKQSSIGDVPTNSNFKLNFTIMFKLNHLLYSN